MEHHFGRYFGNPRKHYGEQHFSDSNSGCGQFVPYRKFNDGKMEHVRFPKSHQTRRCSPSLIQMKKVNRDRARMSAFILRKTAENLPFGYLDNNELVKLGTNNSLRVHLYAPSKQTAIASTQTLDQDNTSLEMIQTECDRLRFENAQLAQENRDLGQLKDELLRLTLEVSATETLKSQNAEIKMQLQHQQTRDSEKSGVILELLGHKNQLDINLRNLESALNEANMCNDELQEDLQNSEYNLSCAQAEISSLHSMHSCQPTYTQDYYNSQECYTYDQHDQHQGFKPQGRRPRRGR